MPLMAISDRMFLGYTHEASFQNRHNFNEDISGWDTPSYFNL